MRKAETESIDLFRGNKVVSTITGAFGQSLRETRLTAMLGYLIALSPNLFIDLFGFKGRPQEIALETHHQLGRSDILIRTTEGTGVIEAKIDATDPLKQATKHAADWTALITHHRPQQFTNRSISYVSWDEIASVLKQLASNKNALVRLLSGDLLAYLEEHRMTRGRKATEIYAREINETTTLKFFLGAHLYGCKYEASSALPDALYFAPHFGQSVAKQHFGISHGISYIARIQSVDVASNWNEFITLLCEQRGNSWVKKKKQILDEIESKWFYRKKPQLRSFVFLGDPQLAFNPPIKKENLQKGKGWLSKRTFSFEELLMARE